MSLNLDILSPYVILTHCHWCNPFSRIIYETHIEIEYLEEKKLYISLFEEHRKDLNSYSPKITV